MLEKEKELLEKQTQKQKDTEAQLKISMEKLKHENDLLRQQVDEHNLDIRRMKSYYIAIVHSKMWKQK